MPNYLVERHLPNFSGEQLSAAAALAKATTSQMTQEGSPVRYLRSFFIPGEDKCFCLFESGSPELVKEANDRAGLPYLSVSEALYVSADDVG